MIAVVADAEVTLNGYHYPQWAHNVGWSIVALILSPLPICFLYNWYKYKSVERAFEPADDWLPAIKPDKQQLNYENDEENVVEQMKNDIKMSVRKNLGKSNVTFVEEFTVEEF